MSKRKSTKVQRFCKQCGKEFYVYPSNIKLGLGKFCGQACYWKSLRSPMADRFFNFIGSVTESGCILWKGFTNEDGYGKIVTDTKGIQSPAHRVSYEFFVGPVPPGVWVLHKCDNPSCINPTHLFLGDNLINIADKTAKGRQSRGESHGRAVLTETQVKRIRKLHSEGEFIRALAREYDVDRATIASIVHRRNWKHIP